VRRRDLIKLFSFAITTWPRAAIVHAADRPRRIALLFPVAEEGEAVRAADALKNELARLGWLDGTNLRIHERWAGPDPGRLREAATELVALAPDVMYATAGPAVSALVQATRTISIVFTYIADPVERGIVSSLKHPGGNITGFTNYDFAFAGKWVELIKEAEPRVARIVLMFNPDTAPYVKFFLPSMTVAAGSLSLEFTQDHVRNEKDIDRAFADIIREHGSGLIVGADVFTYTHRKRIVNSAADGHLPAVYPWKEGAVAGGLLSYGPDTVDLARRAASYVDRILRGEKAGDLPVQQPTKYELVINLKTAKALGLTIPPSLLVRADEVIE
jgi:ABC-type uncharacterized transport system substrate-binding protein